MELVGIFKKASNIKTFESGFTVQEFYLDNQNFNQSTGELYSNHLKFQLIGDKTNLISNIKPGDRIKVFFRIKGQTFIKEDGTKGHAQNLNAWKVEAVQSTNTTQAPPSTPTPKPQQAPEPKVEEEEDDDLPF